MFIALIIISIISIFFIFFIRKKNKSITPNPTPIPIDPNQIYGLDEDSIYLYDLKNGWSTISQSNGFTTITLNDGYIYSVINNDVVYTIPGSSNFTKLDNNNELINVISFDRNKALWGFSSDGKLYTKGILYNSPWIMTLDLSIDKSINMNIKSFCFDTDNVLYGIDANRIFKLDGNNLVYITDTNISQFLLTLHCTEEEGKKMFYGVDKTGISLWTYDLTNWNIMDIQNKQLYDIYVG